MENWEHATISVTAETLKKHIISLNAQISAFANPVPKEINMLNLFENIIMRMVTPLNIV